jgi:hypothetical protein
MGYQLFTKVALKVDVPSPGRRRVSTWAPVLTSVKS